MEPDYDRCENNQIYSAAEYFAGMALIRWYLGFPLGDVVLEEDGTGECEVPKDRVYPKARLPHGVTGLEVPFFGELSSAQFEAILDGDPEAAALPAPEPYIWHVPSPQQSVMIYLGGVYCEHRWTFPQDPCDWPAQLLDQHVWPVLTPAYCLTQFEEPLTPPEALRFLYGQMRAIYDRYVDRDLDAFIELSSEIAARLGWSGEAITAHFEQQRRWLAFCERQEAQEDAGIALPCGHMARSAYLTKDDREGCHQCDLEAEEAQYPTMTCGHSGLYEWWKETDPTVRGCTRCEDLAAEVNP